MRSGFRDETSACKCVNGYDPSHHHHPAGGFLDGVAGRNGRIVARTSAPLCRSYTHAHIHTDQITEGYRTGKRTRPGLSCRRDLPLSGSFTFLFSSFPRQIKLSNSVPFPFVVIYSPLTDLSISSFFSRRSASRLAAPGSRSSRPIIVVSCVTCHIVRSRSPPRR